MTELAAKSTIVCLRAVRAGIETHFKQRPSANTAAGRWIGAYPLRLPLGARPGCSRTAGVMA